MHVGFFLKWQKDLPTNGPLNIIGDELYAKSMVKILSRLPIVSSVALYAPNCIPKKKLDVMIYLNENEPNPTWAKKNVVYMQNAYGEGSLRWLKRFQERKYDGYAFISHKLLTLHKKNGFHGLYLPFGVDPTLFYPRKAEKKFSFDVSYVGNDIKGIERSTLYLLPAAKFNFGLFGNWDIYNPKYAKTSALGFLKYVRNTLRYSLFSDTIPQYRKVFYHLSKGKIQQAKVPVLYSSSKINLNCTAKDCVDWDIVTLRSLEVLACKGFLISDRVPIAEKNMKGCMVFTDGGDDLVKKISYFCKNEKEREKIAEKGYAYVQKHATIEARMCELISYLKKVL